MSKAMVDLALKLSADTAELKRGMREANNSLKSVQTTGNQISSLLKGVAAGMAAAFTAKAIVDGIKNTIVGLTQMADRLLDLEQITGANTDTLQEWQYVAKVSGVNTETFSNAVEGLTQRMARGTGGGKDFNDALKQLNISIRDNQGNLRNGADVTEEAIEKLAAMDNVTQRNILGAKLFTGAWKDLAPIMGNGVEGIKNIREEAHNLGLVFDNEALVKANEFRIELVNLNARVSQITKNLGMALIPMLSNLALGFTKTIDVIKEAFNESVKSSISSDMDEVNDLAERYLSSGLVSTIEEGQEKAANDLLKSLEKQKEYYKGYYGDISQLADREERIFARNRMKDLTERINSLKSFTRASNVSGVGGGNIVGIFNELTEQIKAYDKAINEATSLDDILYFSKLKEEATKTKEEILKTVNALLTLDDNLKDLAKINIDLLPKNMNPKKPLWQQQIDISGMSKPEEEVFDDDYTTVLQNLNDQLTQAESNMWNIVNVAQAMGEALGKSFSDAGGALKGLVGSLLQVANSIIMIAIAKEIEAAHGSIQNFLSGGAWGWVAAAAGVAAITSLWNGVQLADGGLAYGETLATIGEYPGARSNPEVIAPLSDLKNIIGETGGVSGEVRFVIEEDKLVGVLNRYNKKQIYF